MIRVLQVFTIMNRGGAESMIMNYYRKIDRKKVQFDFLVHRSEPGAFDDEIKSLGGVIYRLDPINPLFPKGYYNSLRNFLNVHNSYQIIHSHLNTFSCFPLKIAQEFNIPCRIAHAHIAIDRLSLLSIVSQKESIKETLKKVIKLQLKKKIHRSTTHYFSCGEKAGKWLFGDKTPFATMNNAIDADKFIYNPQIALEYRKKLQLKNELVLGHVGRFTSQKNHFFLLQIFASLVKLKSESRLVLVGDGPLRSKIEQEVEKLGIKDKVLILGVRTDIPELYQLFDVFVFPSFYEGLPVTLIEAQAAGLNTLASDTITKEVQLTSNIHFLPIEETPEIWANKIMELSSYLRQDMKGVITTKAYDIISNTEKIQKFYIDQILK